MIIILFIQKPSSAFNAGVNTFFWDKFHFPLEKSKTFWLD